MAETPPSDSRSPDLRLAATRLAAVQAGYEIDMMGVPPEEVLTAFAAGRWDVIDGEDDTAPLAKPRPNLLRDLVDGTQRVVGALDTSIEEALSGDRQVSGLEQILRSILRTAAFELHHRPNVPARAIIKAYVEVTDAFFDDDSPQQKLVAGALNAMARAARASEFETRTDASTGAAIGG